MKNFNSAPRATCAMVWLFAFMTFFSFGQTSQVIPLPLSVVPFSYNGNANKPRLQTFRSSIIYNPVVYSLPQTFINDFPNGLIDFGDGNGFVSLGTQTTRSINYPNFSEKVIKIKETSTVLDVDAKTLTRINVKAQICLLRETRRSVDGRCSIGCKLDTPSFLCQRFSANKHRFQLGTKNSL